MIYKLPWSTPGVPFFAQRSPALVSRDQSCAFIWIRCFGQLRALDSNDRRLEQDVARAPVPCCAPPCWRAAERGICGIDLEQVKWSRRLIPRLYLPRTISRIRCHCKLCEPMADVIGLIIVAASLQCARGWFLRLQYPALMVLRLPRAGCWLIVALASRERADTPLRLAVNRAWFPNWWSTFFCGTMLFIASLHHP